MIPGFAMMCAPKLAGGGGGTTDPYWANVVSLLHFDGADGSTTFTDEKGKTWTPAGNAQIDTAQSKFGGASGLFDGTGDYISSASHADFGFGSGDWTVEGWINSGATGDRTLLDTRTASNQGIGIYSSTAFSGTFGLAYANNSTVLASSPVLFSGSAFQHWAVCRVSGVVKGFVEGVQRFSVTDSRTLASASSCFIGANYAGAQGLPGSIDEVRITKGIARYTANFSPPTAPFPNS